MPSLLYQEALLQLLKTKCSSKREVFAYRDDLIGSLINGTKLRKYSSYFPYLLAKGIDTLILTGSIFSNHVLAMTLLARKHQITPYLITKKRSFAKLCGNSFLLRLLLDSCQVRWIEEEKPIGDLVEKLTLELQKQGKIVEIVPDGAFCKEALEGALSLGKDIEKEKITFSHIFIDAGTGLSAMALVLYFGEIAYPTTLHVVEMAKDAIPFENRLEQVKLWYGKGISAASYKLYSPALCPSFGSTNAEVFTFIKKMAKEEGLILEPIYSAKLFFTAFEIIQKQGLQGSILIIHSGGTLSLMGFSDAFKPWALA